MSRRFADLAAFYVVYIREAHAADSDWSERLARELNINQPKTYQARVDVARKCLVGLKISIPCLIDNMNNTTEKAYAGARGPRGFKPQEVRKWLVQYKSNMVAASQPAKTGGDAPPSE